MFVCHPRLDPLRAIGRAGRPGGANGSGKSTLLKQLDGIIAPTGGRMRALGLDIAAVVDGFDAFRFHNQVGLVFQDPDIQLFSATVLDAVLEDRDLLIAANLIHEHLHEHGGVRHSHPHATDESHDGPNDRDPGGLSSTMGWITDPAS